MRKLEECLSPPAAMQALAVPLLGLEHGLLLERLRTHRFRFLPCPDSPSSKGAVLILINEYVSLLLLLGFLPGAVFSCLQKKTFHSKQNPLCPCVAAAWER